MPKSMTVSEGLSLPGGAAPGRQCHMQQREALWLSSISFDRHGLGKHPLREPRFKTAVSTGPFDLESKCNLWEILSLQQEAGL